MMQEQKYQIGAGIQKKYEEILRITIPEYPKVCWEKIFLGRSEAVLINAIAVIWEKQGQYVDAIELYQKCLKNVEMRRVNSKYPKRYTEFILSNAASCFGNVHDMEMAISLSEKVLRMQLLYGSGKGMAEVLYEIAWNLKEGKIENSKIFFSASWYKALLEGNREFISFLQERNNKFGYED